MFSRILKWAQVALTLFFLSSTVTAMPSSVLLGERMCSEQPRVCVTGSVYYDADSRVLSFKGRVGQTRQRGTMSLKLSAFSNRANKVDTVRIRIPISGRSFDLIEAKSRTGTRQKGLKWKLRSVHFKE